MIEYLSVLLLTSIHTHMAILVEKNDHLIASRTACWHQYSHPWRWVSRG